MEAAIYEYATVLDLNVIRRVLLANVSVSSDDTIIPFLRDVQLFSGLASAVVKLTINTGYSAVGFDKSVFLAARKYMLRLSELELSRMDLDQEFLTGIAPGLSRLTLLFCKFTRSALAVAASLVPSLRASCNTILNVERRMPYDLASPYTSFDKHFDALDLIATSRTESIVYAQLLARVCSVTRLDVRGIANGWNLGGGWDSVEDYTCVYGLPAFMDPVNAVSVMLSLPLLSISRIFPILKPNRYGSVTLSIDLTLQSSLHELTEMWYALHDCGSGTSVRVVFVVQGGIPEVPATAFFYGLALRLAESNIIADMTLCPNARISVMDSDMINFYCN
ncbi:hypothetical protein CYLTODRAFT_424627, partial [Cylindrobasidium torrendii FP15055 ss-10]